MLSFVLWLVAVALTCAVIGRHKIPSATRARIHQSIERLASWLRGASLDALVKRVYATTLQSLARIRGSTTRQRIGHSLAVGGLVVLVPMCSAVTLSLLAPEGIAGTQLSETMRYWASVGLAGLTVASISFAFSLHLTIALLRLASRYARFGLYLAVFGVDLVLAIVQPILVASAVFLGRSTLGVADQMPTVFESNGVKWIMVSPAVDNEAATEDLCNDLKSLLIAEEESETFRQVATTALESAHRFFGFEGFGGLVVTDEDYKQYLMKEVHVYRQVNPQGRFLCSRATHVLPVASTETRLPPFVWYELQQTLASLVRMARTGDIQIGVQRAVTNWTFVVCLVPTLVHFSLLLWFLTIKVGVRIARTPIQTVLDYVLLKPDARLDRALFVWAGIILLFNGPIRCDGTAHGQGHGLTRNGTRIDARAPLRVDPMFRTRMFTTAESNQTVTCWVSKYTSEVGLLPHFHGRLS